MAAKLPLAVRLPRRPPSELVSRARLKRPARARERLRLAAALGVLAALAIITGGLASLAVGSPVLERAPPPAAETSVLDWIPNIELSPRTQVEAELEQAEQALERARATLERAREQGSLSEEELEELELRIEAYAPYASPPASDESPAPSRFQRRSLAEPPRSL